jgi:excisionase family DNA binding protein
MVHPSQDILTETEASTVLSVSVRTLQAWRLRGGGPKYLKFGRSVRYRRDELQAFIEAASRAHTSQTEAA